MSKTTEELQTEVDTLKLLVTSLSDVLAKTKQEQQKINEFIPKEVVDALVKVGPSDGHLLLVKTDKEVGWYVQGKLVVSYAKTR